MISIAARVEEMRYLLLRTGWPVLLDGKLVPREEIERERPTLGAINLMADDYEMEVVRASRGDALARKYPWRVRFLGCREYGFAADGWKETWFKPLVLFRTRREARACVTTIKMLRSMS